MIAIRILSSIVKNRATIYGEAEMPEKSATGKDETGSGTEPELGDIRADGKSGAVREKDQPRGEGFGPGYGHGYGTIFPERVTRESPPLRAGFWKK